MTFLMSYNMWTRLGIPEKLLLGGDDNLEHCTSGMPARPARSMVTGGNTI